MPPAVAAARRRRAVHRRDRHARAPQELRAPRRRVRRARGRAIPTSGSSSPATTAPPGPRSTPRSPACPPPCATRVVLAGGVSDAGRRALLENATLLAYPSIYEGFGFPVLEAMTAGVPVVAARAGRSPRSRATRRCSSNRPNEHALADADGSRAHRRRDPRRARSRAAATACTRSRGTTPRARSPRATGGSRSPADA